LKKNAKQNDIALKIDTALATVEKNNPSLKGALPDNYYSRLDLDVAKLASLLDTINNIDTLKDKQQDVVGRVYEYFLSKFALAEGKGKGEFYTPKTIFGDYIRVTIFGSDRSNCLLLKTLTLQKPSFSILNACF